MARVYECVKRTSDETGNVPVSTEGKCESLFSTPLIS